MQPAEAFELLESFEREGVRGDSLSYSLLMRACVRARASDLAERALRLMQQEGLHPAPCTLHPAPCTLHPAP